MADSLYVSPTGSDSNNGSQAAPFRSILAASKNAQPGTVVHVGAGDYSGGFTTSSSGNAGAHISYVSDTPGGARIVGAGGSSETAWHNKGDYVDIKGFEIDGSGSQANGWRVGFYGTGSHESFVGGTVHDILTDPGAFAQASSNGSGGAAIEMDRYNGGVDGLIDGNLVYNIGPAGKTSSTVQGIYMTETGTVSNNIVHSIVGTGVHLWHGADHIDIVNNTINGARGGGVLVGSGDSGATSTSGDYVNVANNIVTNSVYGVSEQGTTGVHNTYSNNLMHGNKSADFRLQHGLTATGTVTADPKLVNPDGNDYHLQAGSPAIGAALASAAPATDFSGATRSTSQGLDLGALETGAAASPTPSPATAPITTRTLLLDLSEDAYVGAATFTVAVDGKTIGAGQTVTASHAAGESQPFSFDVALAPGPHDIAVNFLNDRWDGTPGTDRNLYVNSISIGGAGAADAPFAMYSGGDHHSAVNLTS